MKKSIEAVVWRTQGGGLQVQTGGSLPPMGTKVVVTWEEPEPEVTCCEKGRYLILRMPDDSGWYMKVMHAGVWEVHRVVACPFCGEKLL